MGLAYGLQLAAVVKTQYCTMFFPEAESGSKFREHHMCSADGRPNSEVHKETHVA